MIKLVVNDGGDGLTVVILWVCDRLSRGVGAGVRRTVVVPTCPCNGFWGGFDAENFFL